MKMMTFENNVTDRYEERLFRLEKRNLKIYIIIASYKVPDSKSD